MSVILDGPHTISVYREVAGFDSDNNPIRVPSTTPLLVPGRMRPLTASEASDTGQDLTTTYSFQCRAFPAGAFALVKWSGRDWDVVGEPRRTSDSPRVTYDQVLLRARTPAVS